MLYVRPSQKSGRIVIDHNNKYIDISNIWLLYSSLFKVHGNSPTTSRIGKIMEKKGKFIGFHNYGVFALQCMNCILLHLLFMIVLLHCSNCFSFYISIGALDFLHCLHCFAFLALLHLLKIHQILCIAFGELYLLHCRYRVRPYLVACHSLHYKWPPKLNLDTQFCSSEEA